MTISHKNLPEADIHEVKGASTATQYHLLQATGTGGTSFLKPQIEQSISSAGSSGTNEIVYANGSNGFTWAYPTNYFFGEMGITGNSTGITPSLACLDFADDQYYAKVTGMWTTGVCSGITFSTDKLIVPVAGTYHVYFWASMTGPNAATVAFKYAVNDTTPYSTRKCMRKQGSITDVGAISADGLVTLSAGDSLSLYVAEDAITSGVIIKEGGMMVSLQRDGRL